MVTFVDDSIKKPSQKDSYTKSQREEFLKCALDPEYFIETYVKVVHGEKGAVPFILYDYQRTALRNFIKHKHNIMLFSRQLGKALSIDTPILTTQGWSTMGDIQEGDYVYGDDGNPVMVSMATPFIYDHPCYEIEFVNGEKIIADAEHEWKVKSIKYENTLKTTEEMYEDHIDCALYIDAVKNPIPEYDNNITIHMIKSITPVEPVPVRCIKVDNENEMFLCGKSLIPTHNTTLAAAYLLWYAMFHKDKTVLVTSHNLKGAIEILDRIKFSYKELPNHIRDAVVEFNKTSVVFKNGSRIVCRATSPDSARGLTVSLLYSDESSFIRDSIQTSFYAAIRPTLSSSNGASIFSSTPGNDDDLFAKMWRGANDNILPNGEESEVGKNGYCPTFAMWKDHPERTEEWAVNERANMGEEMFLREHENKFISFYQTLIDSMVLTGLESSEPLFRMGEVRWYKKPDPTCSYYVVLDPSLGTKGDWSAIQVVEMPTLEHVAEWSSNTTPPKEQVQVLYDVLNYLKLETQLHEYDDELPIYWSFENNSIGEAILQTIEDSGLDMFPGTLVSEKRKGNMKKRFRRGVNTTNKNKIISCSKFKSLVDSGKFKPRSAGALKQLKNFTAKGAGFAASSGNDDLVMALILCIRLIEMTKNWEIYDADIMSDKIDTEFDEPMGFVI